MLYFLAHLIRDHFGFLWDWLEWINSLVFRCRYHSSLRRIPLILKEGSGRMINKKNGTEVLLTFRLANESDAASLSSFFAKQPEEYYTFFRPHAFDEKTLRSLARRDSFIMMVATIGEEIVGYFFLRSFVNGSSYLGKMVGEGWQGNGICKRMCLLSMKIATTLNLRMFESINKKNLASLRSSSVLKQVILQELDNDDLLIEDFPLC